ncbi:MAG: hypothetical protein E4H13_03805, partial [Calditrichales bacterium]
MNTIATVDGHCISLQEFQARIAENRSEIVRYYRDNFEMDYSKDFWDTAVKGQTPGTLLKRRILNKLVENKIKQIIATEYGIIEDISYNRFVENLEQENQRRTNALKNKKIIYGPTVYSEPVFYHYQIANMENELKKLLSINNQSAIEDEILSMYNTYKDSLCLKELRSIYYKFSVNLNQPSGEQNPEIIRSNGIKILQRVQKQLKSGSTFHQIESAFSREMINLECQEIERDEDSAIGDELNADEATLASRINDLKPGEMTDLIMMDNK